MTTDLSIDSTIGHEGTELQPISCDILEYDVCDKCGHPLTPWGDCMQCDEW